MAELPTRSFGDSELDVSVVGLGCNNFGRRVDLDGTRAAVEAALAEDRPELRARRAERRMKASRRRAGLWLALVASAVAGAWPAVASAATIALDRACYDEGAPMTLIGTGFTPGSTVSLKRSGSSTSASATVDPSGGFATELTAPSLGTAYPAHRSFTMSATDDLDPRLTATAAFQAATFAVSITPSQAPPSKVVRFSFSGFTSGAPIYGHFLLQGKVRATIRYGVAAGPCGVLKALASLYPGVHPADGLYRLQFDSSRRYYAGTTPKLRTTLDISRKAEL